MRPSFALTCAGAVVLFAAAYSNSLPNAFHFDDDHVIERNPFIRDLSNLPRFFTDAQTFSVYPRNATYRPLVSVTLAIDHAVAGGLNPVPFHVTQLLLFACVGVLLLVVARRLYRDAEGEAQPWHRWAALFAAALFCVHTANTQPGNYISARSELLSALGVLGAFAVYLHAPRLRRMHLFLLPMIIGALAKPPAVLFAPLLFVYQVLFERRPLRSALWRTLPSFAVAVATFLFVEGMNPPAANYGDADRLQYLWTQASVWLRYVGLFFVPVGLSADTDLQLLPTWFDGRVFAGALVALLSLGATLYAARTRPEWRSLAFGIVWFWIGLLPTSSIIPLGEMTNDHRMFLGYLGLCFGISGFLFERARTLRLPMKPAVALAVAVLLAHAVGTWSRNRVWRTEEALWADVVLKSPKNGRGWMNYGLTQMAAGRLGEAKRLFLHARTLTPNYPTLEVNLGVVHATLGDHPTAEIHFRRAITLWPEYGAAHRYFAGWLIDRGRGPEALLHLERAIEHEPREQRSRRGQLELLAARGDREGLERAAQAWLALTEDPVARGLVAGRPPFSPTRDDAYAWYDLGVERTGEGRHVDAALAYRAALARDGAHAAAWNNLGWSLQALGFKPEAAAAFETALRHDPSFERARNNLQALGEVP